MLKLTDIITKNVISERPYLKSIIINEEISLNEIGKLIFLEIDGEKNINKIISEVIKKVDNDDIETISDDILEFMNELLENGFIKVVNV